MQDKFIKKKQWKDWVVASAITVIIWDGMAKVKIPKRHAMPCVYPNLSANFLLGFQTKPALDITKQLVI